MNIRERREELGMSQYALAKEAQITQSFLCDIEKGRSKPSADVAIRLMSVLKMPEEAEAVRKSTHVMAELLGAK